jgi:hypothetical protein
MPKMQSETTRTNPASTDWKRGYAHRHNGLMCERCAALVPAEPLATTAHNNHHAKIEQLLAANRA